MSELKRSRWLMKIERRWHNSPLLPLLQLLVYNFWFRLAFLGLVGLAIFLALFLPKRWRSTPPDFKPVVKISGLDLVQAWSLKRSALKAMAAGQNDMALHAWVSAVANTPGNPELLRGSLNFLLHVPEKSTKQMAMAVNQSSFLLRLTHTNSADLDLTLQLYEKYRFYDWMTDLLAPLEAKLSPVQEAAYMKALFHQDHLQEFAERWAKLTSPSQANPELALYHAAYLAGWGPPETAREGRRQLEAATEEPARLVVATRLQLAVLARLGEADGYGQALRRLELWREDSLLDQIGYWKLLAAVGRKAEAKDLSQAYPNQPNTPLETFRLAQIYISLDLVDYAHDFLKRYVPQFGFAPQLWLMYANLLIEHKRWDDLRALAAKIRQQEQVRNSLAGFSYYLEGRAELAQGRRGLGETAFFKAVEFPYEYAQLGLNAAASMIQMGYPKPGQDLLRKLENELRANPQYWHIVALAAFNLRQPEVMLTAAAKAHDMKPENSSYANNYAAALLFNRQRPEQAVTLTRQILSKEPRVAGAQLNHALALLLGQRRDEAEVLLKIIPPEKLNPQENSSLNMAWFDVYLHRRQYEKARQVSERINSSHLFPAQLKWLEDSRRELPEKAAKKS